MGLCASGAVGDSGDQKFSSSKVKKTKLLLLGAAGVGKSTIFKQMRVLYKGGFEEEVTKEFTSSIFENVLNATIVTAKCALEHDVELDETLLDCIERPLVAIRTRTDGEDIVKVEDSVWDAVESLWKVSGMQPIFEQLPDPSKREAISKTKLEATAPYFLSNLKRIRVPDFKPSNDDMLRLRRVTEAADTISFRVEMVHPVDNKLNIMEVECTDVGGQCHHEYDWKKYSAKANAVVYVAALSEFCVMTPDGKSNMLSNQLTLLAKVFTSEAFSDKEIIVLLNKSDLLVERLKTHKVKNYFPKYRGDNSEHDVIEFFEDVVETILTAAVKKSGHLVDGDEVTIPQTVKTCALDTEFVRNILQTFFVSLLASNMKECGFIL